MKTTGDVFQISRMREYEPRSTGSLVAKVAKKDGEFTMADLEQARLMLDDPEALEALGISRHLHAALPRQLDRLEEYLASDRGRWSRMVDPDTRATFCKAFRPQALFSKDLRACAEALLEASVSGGEHLNLGEYLKMRRFWTHYENDTEPSDDIRKAGFAKFKAAADAGIITREAFGALHGIFLDESVARSQFQHGPVRIGDREFDNVYKLDTGKTKVEEMDRDALKAYILRRFEAKGKALHDCFYDRMYVCYQGELYAILNDEVGIFTKDSLTGGRRAIYDDAAVTMREDGRLADVGRVVHIQPTVNTLGGAFGKVFSDALDLVSGDGPLKELLDAEGRYLKKDTSEGVSTTNKLLMLVAAGVGLPVAVTATKWAAVILAAAGLYATGRNLAKYVRDATNDFKMKPVYHAMRVTLTTEKI